MKFMVRRSSDILERRVPCEEARKEKYIRMDVRNASKPENISAYKGQDPAWWYSEGTNHRVVNRRIVRDFEDEAWFIELDTLEDLLNFKKKYGPLVIEQCSHNSAITVIEIYDDYRE